MKVTKAVGRVRNSLKRAAFYVAVSKRAWHFVFYTDMQVPWDTGEDECESVLGPGRWDRRPETFLCFHIVSVRVK